MFIREITLIAVKVIIENKFVFTVYTRENVDLQFFNHLSLNQLKAFQ